MTFFMQHYRDSSYQAVGTSSLILTVYSARVPIKFYKTRNKIWNLTLCINLKYLYAWFPFMLLFLGSFPRDASRFEPIFPETNLLICTCGANKKALFKIITCNNNLCLSVRNDNFYLHQGKFGKDFLSGRRGQLFANSCENAALIHFAK